MLPKIIQGVREQSRLAISKAISIVENNRSGCEQLLSSIYSFSGSSHRIGITGPPGAGKSSLTNSLVSFYRNENKKVAVIAIDPTSPFSGGAVLGDRIRMTSHSSDADVFIRSLASRGSRGGLTSSANQIGDVFDSAGYDIIIYETVGVGQIELDIIESVDTVVVVLVPESGDEVQMLKAGLMEIGDIFAINKSDRPGANKLMITLKNIISSNSTDDKWSPDIFKTVALDNTGVDSLFKRINDHGKFIIEKGLLRKKILNRYKKIVSDILKEKYLQNIWNNNNSELLNVECTKERKSQLSPYEFANKLIKHE